MYWVSTKTIAIDAADNSTIVPRRIVRSDWQANHTESRAQVVVSTPSNASPDRFTEIPRS
jgi:hypothetical protein